MNLAVKDIRHTLPRFLITLLGVGLLITASVGMIGLYRGIVQDATLLIEEIGADFWIVQGGRAGPFAEPSVVSSSMDRRVEGLDGVARVRRFMQSDQQILHEGEQRRATVVGLDYPKDRGEWVNLVAGRYLGQSRYEVIADESLGFALGDRITLARDDYEVVGLTTQMISGMGDGLIFLAINDAVDIARRKANEEILLARAASGREAVFQESKIAAILAEIEPGADEAALRRAVLSWGDANILSSDEQSDLFLNQRLWRLKVQILSFTGVLMAVMTIVISLIVYTMTLEKLHQISLLKLIGARNGLIYGMIVQQAVLIGLGGYAVGVALAHGIFPFFPRRVVLDPQDLGLMLGAVLLIGLLAAQLGIRRAMQARAQDVLS
ncbi:MAG: ABC transporter permease [Pseudomonadota bacterium]